MRIVDTTQTGSSAPVQTGRTGATRGANPANGNGASSDKVSPSGDSVELSGFSGRVSQTLASASASRAQKVSQIAAAVQSGTYKVDSHAVSRALVDNAISEGSGR